MAGAAALVPGCYLEHELMADVRQTIVRPLGLLITPNHYGQYAEGGLEIADNCVMRVPGEVWSAPNVVNVQAVGAANDKIRRLFAVDAGHVFVWSHAASNSWIITEAGNTCTTPTTHISPSGPWESRQGRIYPVRARERLLVNSDCGVWVCDSMAPANAADRTFRMAGMPQPKFSAVALTSVTGGGAIPNNIMVAYTAVLTREFSDGYIIKSVPAPAFKILQVFASPQNVQLTVRFNTSSTEGAIAGDFLEIYRTDGLSTTSSAADAGVTFKMVHRHAITAAEITAHQSVVTDTVALSAPFFTTTGKELYTNPLQEGSTGANRQPDVNYAQAVFKGFTFYGNLIERPQLTVNVPGGIGTTQTAAQNTVYFRTFGIGERTGAGTVTSGSAIITGIAASDLVGVKIGQAWTRGSGFQITNTVLAVGATTITMDSPAIGNDTAFAVSDRIQWTFAGLGLTLDLRIANPGDLLLNLGDNTNAVAGLNGFLEVTANQNITVLSLATAVPVDPAMTFVFEQSRPNTNDLLNSANLGTVIATNGANYSPPIPEFSGGTPLTLTPIRTGNLLRWSKDSEPEHVPSVNETQVGTGQIIQMVATKDALWIFCTDGIYRLSGDGGQWRVDLLDPGCFMSAPKCGVSMRETVYAYTNYGFVAVTDAGVEAISVNAVRNLLPGDQFAERSDMLVEKNENDNEILVTLGNAGAGTNTVVIYNEGQKAFTRLNATTTGLLNVTAIAYQAQPSSGTAVVLFGSSEPGIAPKFGTWNSTSFLAPTVKFQPFYAGDPMLIKQWADITYIFDSADTGKSFNATMSGAANGTTTLVQSFNDSYGTVGMQRKYAIAPSIQPGYTLAALGSVTQFSGISCRFTAVSVQQWRR